MATYLITGANRGIGLELARQLAGSGHDVIGTARDPSGAAELAGIAKVEACDVGDEDSVRALAKRLSGVPVDVLVNNAGVFPDRHKGLMEFDAESAVACLRVNTVGPLVVSRAVLENLEAGAGKLIVNISSTMGCLAQVGEQTQANFAYRGSKAALNMVTLLTANELRDRGIACVSHHPGWVKTDMGGANAQLTTEQSASTMIAAWAKLTMAETGRFLDTDGSKLPW